ncbi:MAG: AarF/UbiB family protein [Actinomycetota bacterium]|nr:AarF/UbiB family protein [Actinomycetota bacterium]
MRRRDRWSRALEVTRVARKSSLFRVLREIGVAGQRPATPEAAREFRRALEALGTTYVKLGQLLSSRPDLMPDEYIAELTSLVDEVPPVPFAELEPVIRRELGSEAFARIDPEPLAAASIAQIHRALLADGRDVVVKVRRPGALEQARIDLDLLRSAADLFERRSERAQLLQLSALAEEVDQHLRAELDFTEEANNTELVGRMLADNASLVVPQVIHPYVTEEVLVLEHIDGKRVGPAHGLDRERASILAREFFRAYVHQVAAEGVYHADPHRGNVLVTLDGRLALLDFGLLGRLDDDTRTGIAQLLLALARNRGNDVAALVLGLSVTTLESDEPGFVAELRRKLPRYHWRPLSGIRAGEALADLQRMSVKYGIRLPTSFALVGKTLAQADSIARTLDESLDPIELLRDDSLALMLNEGERRLAPNELMTYAYTQLAPLARLPRRIGQVADRLEEGTLRVGIVPAKLETLEGVVRGAANRVGAALIVAALLVSSALMARVNDTVALVGFVLSFLLGLYMLWKIVRTPGEL